jgi:hypothetical protein
LLCNSSCGAATYASGDSCANCPENSKSDSSRAFCICNVGYFLLYISSGNGTVPKCFSCAEGAQCSEAGVEWTTITARSGYWRASNVTNEFLKCARPSNCAG